MLDAKTLNDLTKVMDHLHEGLGKIADSNPTHPSVQHLRDLNDEIASQFKEFKVAAPKAGKELDKTFADITKKCEDVEKQAQENLAKAQARQQEVEAKKAEIDAAKKKVKVPKAPKVDVDLGKRTAKDIMDWYVPHKTTEKRDIFNIWEDWEEE